MSVNLTKAKPGDIVIVTFGFENTEHQILNVVDDMVKVQPKHCVMGHWVPNTRIEAVFTPSSATVPEPVALPEKKTGFFSRLFK